MHKQFIIKHNFHKIKQYSIVNYITIINSCCLIEDIKTNNREWIMQYDLYPYDEKYDVCGWWSYDKNMEDVILKINNLILA